jgi:hypothetical protein
MSGGGAEEALEYGKSVRATVIELGVRHAHQLPEASLQSKLASRVVVMLHAPAVVAVGVELEPYTPIGPRKVEVEAFVGPDPHTVLRDWFGKSAIADQT